MKNFLIKVSVFNGKFWREGKAKIFGSSGISSAISRAVRESRKDYPRKRIEKIKVEAEKLKGL